MRYRWEAAVLGVAAIWGATFVLVQDAVERTPPFLFLALRFAIAAAVLAPFRGARGLTRRDLAAGVLVGVALFAGFAFQTVALQYTTSTNTGFITSLYVVLTPLVALPVFRRLPGPGPAFGVLLATVGLVLLADPRGLTLGRGDGLALACAAAFAVQIVLVGRFARETSPLGLAWVQIAVTALLSAIWSAAGERAPLPGADGTLWTAVAVTAVGATALGLWVQARAQREIRPVRAGVLFSAESIFAGVFGYLLAGDRLGGRGYAGAGLIVAGILAAEALRPAEERV